MAKRKSAPAWQSRDGKITFYLGDSLELAARLKIRAALAVLDPPYGTTDLAWDKPVDLAELWRAVQRTTSPTSIAAAFCAQPFATDLINSNRKQFRYELIWRKSRATGFLDAARRPLRAHENICIFAAKFGGSTYLPQFTEGKPYRSAGGEGAKCLHYRSKARLASVNDGRRYPVSVLDVPSERARGRGHTRKPVALLAWIIKTYSLAGQLVFDPFLGSGSSAIAARQCGRRFVGIEKDAARLQGAIESIEAELDERRKNNAR